MQSTPGNTRLRNNALLGNWDIKYLLTQSLTTDVIVIAQRRGFLALSYADDTQLYFHDKASSVETRLQHLKDRISEIDWWMSSNHLLLNADNRQFIWLGTRQQLAKVQCHIVDHENVSLPVATKVIIHHTWTVPKQTKDNTISLGLRHVTLALLWLFRKLELAPYKRSNLLTELLTQ